MKNLETESILAAVAGLGPSASGLAIRREVNRLRAAVELKRLSAWEVYQTLESLVDSGILVVAYRVGFSNRLGIAKSYYSVSAALKTCDARVCPLEGDRLSMVSP